MTSSQSQRRSSKSTLSNWEKESNVEKQNQNRLGVKFSIKQAPHYCYKYIVCVKDFQYGCDCLEESYSNRRLHKRKQRKRK